MGCDQPALFSGTGCEADGTAVPASGYLTHAELCVGDTVVKEYWDTGAMGCPSPVPTDGSVTTNAPNTHNYSQPLKALFDSTHFKDSTMIVLKLKVWDSNGGYYEGKIQGKAYNKSFIMLNNTAESSGDFEGMIGVYIALQDMNHSLPESTYDQYHRDDIFQNMPYNTVFYADTHASIDDFGDCYCPFAGGNLDNTCNYDIESPTATDSKGRSMRHLDITHIVASKNIDEPPYNLVFIDGCETSGVTGGSVSYDLSSAFGIYSYYNDRAFLGWHNEVFSTNEANINFKDRFWANLLAGDTLQVAIIRATIDGDPLGQGVRGDHPESTEAVFPVFIGSGAMKLHGVYTGSQTVWYKPL